MTNQQISVSIPAGTTITSLQVDHSPNTGSLGSGFHDFSFENLPQERPTMLSFASGNSLTTVEAVRSPNGFSSCTVTHLYSPGCIPNFTTSVGNYTSPDEYHMQIANSFANALSSAGSTITTYQAVVSPTGCVTSTYTQLRTPPTAPTSLPIPSTNRNLCPSGQEESLVFLSQSEPIAGPSRLSALTLPPSQPLKKRRGRPRKNPDGAQTVSSAAVQSIAVDEGSCGESPLSSSQLSVKRGPGRPKGSKNQKPAIGHKRKSTEDQSNAPVAKRACTDVQLEDLSIPVVVRGRGRPRKAGKPVQFKPTKSFASKHTKLQNEGNNIETFSTFNFVLVLTSRCFSAFLTWFVGNAKAKAYLQSGEKVVEEDVVVDPRKISSAVQEEPIRNQLNLFQSLFTEDAWTSVLSLGRPIPFTITITCQGFNFFMSM